MKVGGTKGTTASLLAGAEAGARVYRKAAAERAKAARTPADAVSLFGLDEAELTPKVREALAGLLAEVDALRRQLDAAKRRISELEELADRDPLAPAFNRRAFVRELDRMISFIERYRTPVSLIFFDIDNMKAINDAHGHEAGDATILAVARILADNTRGSDVLGRLGGDEFALLLPQAERGAAAAKATALADRIAQTPVSLDGVEISVRVSYGVHTIRPGDDAAAALAHADKRMYAAKRTDSEEGA